MTAERLREAAARLREVAEAATPGPWIASPKRDDNEYYNPRVFARSTWAAECLPPREGGTADADYIATMSPSVALALADWLDFEVAKTTPTGHLAKQFDGTPMFSIPPAALAVCDALLGSTS